LIYRLINGIFDQNCLFSVSYYAQSACKEAVKKLRVNVAVEICGVVKILQEKEFKKKKLLI
jgi:hypothetical protein